MRVLVVDQDSASNEAIARSLRDLYTVDAVTNKGDCLDLLRSNTFEVIVAGERLEDGSGLELLGQVSKKWPAILRIFAADRHRLQLLRGRLGPFELFQTLAYPIDPERLIATLSLADAAQGANADTSDIQHVVLSGDPPHEISDVVERTVETVDSGISAESEESQDFPAPRPVPRVAPMEHAQALSRGARVSARGGRAAMARSAPGQRTRRNGAAGQPMTRTGSGLPAARGAPASAEAGRSPRQTRAQGAMNRAPPVRFPPLERVPPLERTPPLQSPSQSSARRPGVAPPDSIAEAAVMARAARSNYESTTEEFDTRRLAVMVGGGAVVVFAVVALGLGLFRTKTEPVRPAPPVVHTPQYPPEVTDLVTQTEAAFKSDDFKSARADVDRLRQISPSHPRLTFFEGLLVQRADGSRGGTSSAAAGRGTQRKNGQSSRRGSPNGIADDKPTSAASAAARTSPLAPETPPGFSKAAATSVESPHSDSAPAHSAREPASVALASDPPATSAETPHPTAAASSAAPVTHTQASPTPAARRTPGPEPPPVIQEARLIRRVNPDYPSAARRDGIEGSVDLEVTVSMHGVVGDVSVIQATPPGTFEKSALAAVRKWKYDPRFVDGLASEAHLKVHLDFGPNK